MVQGSGRGWAEHGRSEGAEPELMCARERAHLGTLVEISSIDVETGGAEV
jgi:hypothetical protein